MLSSASTQLLEIICTLREVFEPNSQLDLVCDSILFLLGSLLVNRIRDLL